MQNLLKVALAVLVLGVASIHTANSQEFLISGGSNNTISGGVAFDGTNYLIGLTGDAISDSNISVQFISPAGQLVGSRIQLGETGCAPSVAFDGTNYLLIWCDRYVAFLDDGNDAGLTNIYGRFINPLGSFVGSRFTVETDAYIKGSSIGNVHFNGTNYFFTYCEDDAGVDIGRAYGRFISTTGSLLGSPIQISSANVGGVNIAFDGANYLAVFEINATSVYGQFISASGSLVGNNFPIDDSPNLSDNPVSVVYGGSKYLVAFHDQQSTGSGWNLFAHFVSTAGVVNANKITICDSNQNPFLCTLAYDGTNFISAWISLNSRQIRGQFRDITGAHFNSEFVIFDSVAGVLPLGGVATFSANQYLAVCTKLNWSKSDKADNTNLGIYGKFVEESTGIIENSPDNFSVLLFPNPTSDIITLDINSNENLAYFIYDVLGTLVKSGITRQDQRQINIDDLSDGIFIVEIKFKEWSGKQKLIIQR